MVLRLLALLLSVFSLVATVDAATVDAATVDAAPGVGANATLYTLCRNSDLFDMLETIANYESRFNGRYHYDWVFLNDQPFTKEFKELVAASVSGTAKFGLVPQEHWSLPESVDRQQMFHQMAAYLNDPDGPVPYADSLSYRHMCRFESGFFYRHPLLAQYRYFWRVEPGVRLHCDVNRDILLEMQQNDWHYGFAISMLEYEKTIRSLFGHFKEALKDLGQDGLLQDSDNYSGFVVDGRRDDYNTCHFWTNFEIGDLDVFRSKEYNDLFERLDATNGFYYERWGDAPVRTLILATILKRGSIHRFADLGYTHAPYTQCPQDTELRVQNRCSCDPSMDFTKKWYSCSWFFDQFANNAKAISPLT